MRLLSGIGDSFCLIVGGVHGRILNLEIVMNELRKLRMSADFFAISSHIISRCSGVLSVIVYLRELTAYVDITLLLSKPGGPLVTLFLT